VIGGLRRVSITLASGSAQNRLPDLTSTSAILEADSFTSLAAVID
jgi:hypothetical protein